MAYRMGTAAIVLLGAHWVAGAIMLPEPYALVPRGDCEAGRFEPTPLNAALQADPSSPVAFYKVTTWRDWTMSVPQPGVFALLALICWPIFLRRPPQPRPG